MIKQVSPYAKFLKDLCTMKRRLNISKKAFLIEQLSAIIQCKTPIKYKDPGCPTISVNIGDTYVEKALLDLGASVNLLSYSVYKQLGLRNSSLLLSHYLWLIEPIASGLNYVPIILVRPFLATTNALINCPNGVMQLTFGNMTLELNIFHLCKRHPNQDEDEQEEACLIDTLIEEHDDKFPVVISSKLSYQQETSLLEVLRKCKEAIGWSISDLKGISPLVCTHHIYLEENAKPIRQPQRQLNPHMQEVVRNEVLKLLQVGIIYSISDSTWVSPTQVVPKKSGVTVVQNEKGESIPTRLTTGWKIEIALEDQEKTTFTCSFEKGIVLGHVISRKGIEVDKAKIEIIVNLPPPTNVKEVRQFLGHAGFYRRFIKDFSKLARPMCALLAKDAKFKWDQNCQHCFEELKRLLTTAPIVRRPNWDLPFEVMCDASDQAMGAILGQRDEGKPYVIYYASKTLNEAQKNYTTTEKSCLRLSLH
ncbi:Retrovirus-related Pol polyprotein from transposon opus [Vitis vinifera]|uniref:Retrovirus-related Pol polyprotein from transposon opus n=1 Tax=Vitis vinifera TaxID=29760 RepID=A0A438INE5_VITVI|nr:Retrovirus-related Pol polyprotein from transposon opus [Vitis vinifera]